MQPYSLRNTPTEETATEAEVSTVYSEEALALAAKEVLTYDELNAYTKAVLLEVASIRGVENLSMSNLKEDIIQALIEPV